jgi:hypothetical protein
MLTQIKPGADCWRRVSRGRLCPICERPDWCLIAADGSAAICARIESPKLCGEAGWLHRLRADWRPACYPVRTFTLSGAGSRLDLERLATDWQSAAAPDRLDRLARSLGLSPGSLRRLGIGWSAAHGAWSFPMQDAASSVLGIRLRREDGRKFAVRGGREGLFLPAGGLEKGGQLFICEGPTDTAALLDLGFADVAGRPSCAGGVRLLVELVQLCQPAAVVIVADSDGPGLCGADKLASVLVAYTPAVRVIAPPAGIKDARAWLQAGATRQDVEKMVQAAPPRQLAVRVREVTRGH